MILIICLVVTFVNAIAAQSFEGNGRFTPYNTKGHGACGDLIDASDGLYAGVAPNYFTTSNPNTDPICQQCVHVEYNSKKLTIPVVEKCRGCKENEMLLSEPAFRQLAKHEGETDISTASWQFVSCDAKPEAQPQPPMQDPIVIEGNGKYFYFNTEGRAGCGGRVNGSTDMAVGVSDYYFLYRSDDPAKTPDDPLCQNQCVQFDYKGQSLTVPIKDKCIGCPAEAIMLSQPALEKLMNEKVPNTVYDWSFVEDGSWKVVPCQ